MRIHWQWLFGDFIDRRWGLSIADQLAVHVRAAQVLSLRPRIWPYMAALLIVMLIGAIVLMLVFAKSATGAGIGAAVVCAGTLLLWWLLMIWLHRRRIMPAIYQSLRVFGHEVCPGCDRSLDETAESKDHCPSCGAPRAIVTCFRCSYVLTGLDAAHASCPECDANQREIQIVGKRANQAVDPLFQLLPDRARIALARRLRIDAAVRGLLTLAVIGAVVALLALLYYSIIGQVHPMSTMAGVLPCCGIVLLAAAPLVAMHLLHRVSASILRGHLRELGYELCRACGGLLHDVDSRLEDCPNCGRSRTPPPDDVALDYALPQHDELAAVSQAFHRVQWSAMAKALCSRGEWWKVLAVCAVAALVAMLVPMHSTALAFGAAVLLAPVMWVWSMRRYRRELRMQGWQALYDAGHDVCPACGVWFRKPIEDAPACPDCGNERNRQPADPGGDGLSSNRCS